MMACARCGNFNGPCCMVVAKLRAENAALKKRIRLARRLLSPLGKRYGEPADVPLWDVDAVLDLRRPLPKARKTR